MTKKDYQELMEFLAAQFGQVHHKLDQKVDKADLDKKADKEDVVGLRLEFADMADELNKKANKEDIINLHLKVVDVADELKEKADKEDISRLYDNIDIYAKNTDTYSQEMELLVGQVNRHERWHQQTANKLGIKFDH